MEYTVQKLALINKEIRPSRNIKITYVDNNVIYCSRR